RHFGRRLNVRFHRLFPNHLKAQFPRPAMQLLLLPLSHLLGVRPALVRQGKTYCREVARFRGACALVARPEERLRGSLVRWRTGGTARQDRDLLDENPAFFQIGLFRETSELPETIFIHRVIEATEMKSKDVSIGMGNA